MWDDSIRRANLSKTHDDEAASTLLKTLVALLDASIDAYAPDTEFWHDYFSVPQWQSHVQESLLLLIPRIYHEAQEILIHMSDLPGEYIIAIMSHDSVEFSSITDTPTTKSLSATTALRFMPALDALRTSQWTERMWVLLEYSLCHRACVMDSSDYIWRNPDHTNDGDMPDTFTTFVRNGYSIVRGMHCLTNTFASQFMELRVSTLTGQAKRRRRSHCLGEALEVIERSKCQIFRDRFLAIKLLLGMESPSISTAIPPGATDACRFVWETALANGDFSPLLLQPQERQRDSNPPSGMPSWLTGYNSLENAEWGLGNQHTPARFPINVNGGVINTELDFVGSIGRIHYLDLEQLGYVASVELALEILSPLNGGQTGTRSLSAAELIDGLNRIFPFNIACESIARHEAGLEYTLEARQSHDGEFTQNVERCIEEYLSAPSLGTQRQYAAQKITQLLRYDEHIAGNLFVKLTRLSRSRGIAMLRRLRGATNGEPICEVQCPEPTCQAVVVFRLDLRENAKLGDRLYRIPGLSYAGSAESGVGLVLDEEGRITGRMLDGSPSCTCQVRQTVEIR